MIRQLLKLAAFATITLGLTAWIGLQILQYQGDARYELTATFGDVTGLFPGDDVKLAGVQVGKVSTISIDGERARVTFTVDEDIDLPADSTAAVRWRNLIGQRYLYLYEGDDTDLLPKDGRGVIPESTDVTDITDLVNTLGPLFQAVDPDQLNDLFETLVQALDGNQEHVASLVDDVNVVLAVLAEREATLQGVLTDYAVITDELARRDQQIQAMVDNLVLLSQTFADNTALVDRALTELAGFGQGLDEVLARNGDHLASIISNLSLITDTAVPRLDELEATFQALPSTLTRLFDIVNDGEYLRIYVPCLSLTAPPCLLPNTLPIIGEAVARADGATTVGPAGADPTGAGRDAGAPATPPAAPVLLDTTEALTDLLLGSLGGDR